MIVLCLSPSEVAFFFSSSLTPRQEIECRIGASVCVLACMRVCVCVLQRGVFCGDSKLDCGFLPPLGANEAHAQEARPAKYS